MPVACHEEAPQLSLGPGGRCLEERKLRKKELAKPLWWAGSSAGPASSSRRGGLLVPTGRLLPHEGACLIPAQSDGTGSAVFRVPTVTRGEMVLRGGASRDKGGLRPAVEPCVPREGSPAVASPAPSSFPRRCLVTSCPLPGDPAQGPLRRPVPDAGLPGSRL